MAKCPLDVQKYHFECLKEKLKNSNVIDSSKLSSDSETFIFLKQLTDFLKCSKQRELMTDEEWLLLDKLYFQILKYLGESKLTIESLNLLAEFFRCFRNACADCPDNQNAIIRTPNIIESTFIVFGQLLQKYEEKEEYATITLRCCIQFLGNFVVRNDYSKNIVCSNISLNIFRKLISGHDLKVQEYSSMLLYNCFKTKYKKMLLDFDSDGHNVINALLDLLITDPVEWSLLCIELLLEEEEFITNIYSCLTIKRRLILLDIIAECINKNHPKLPFLSISSLNNKFQKSCQNIIQMSSSLENELGCMEIVKCLSVLCVATSKDEFQDLQNDPVLINVILDNLKSVHEFGKMGSNVFSAVQDLDLLSGEKEVHLHPAMGFKRDLIRLLGNLVYKHKDNQDKVRIQDGIPLLLDCCNIDANNPFIIQWCIFAIRNLLEDNAENKSVVASITLQDVEVHSPLLNELGIVLEKRDGRCRIISVPK